MVLEFLFLFLVLIFEDGDEDREADFQECGWICEIWFHEEVV